MPHQERALDAENVQHAVEIADVVVVQVAALWLAGIAVPAQVERDWCDHP